MFVVRVAGVFTAGIDRLGTVVQNLVVLSTEQKNIANVYFANKNVLPDGGKE